MQFIAHEISIPEHEIRLWTASRQYMNGEISLKTLVSIEQDYTPPLEVFLPEGLKHSDNPVQKRRIARTLKNHLLQLKQKLHRSI